MLWPYAVLTFVTLVLFKLCFTLAAILGLALTLGYFLSDLRRIPRRLIFVCVAGVVAGALLYFLRLPLLKSDSPLPRSGTATVTGVSRKSVIILDENGSKLRLTGLKKENLPQKYARISFTCSPQEMPEATFSVFEKLSGVKGWCRTLITTTISPPEGSMVKFRKATLAFLYSKFERMDGHSLIAAFLLGDTEELSADELDAFRDMGLMHLFAVSGLNIALLFGLIYLPFRFIGLPGTGSALGYAIATGFLLLLDFPVPLLRAWLFMTIGLAMRMLDRRITSGALLFLTAIIVELLFPLSTFTMSFILSFGITAAILIFYQPILFCFSVRNRIGNFFAGHVALTLAAGLPAMILSFFLFGSANPLSLVYNLLLVPFSGLYLFVSLIYLAFEPARYLLTALDTLYLRFAGWHGSYVSAHFPLAERTWQLAAIALTAAALVALYVLAERSRLWTARRNIRWLIPTALGVLLVPYLLTEYPSRAIYAVPNQLWIYERHNISTVGNKIFAETPDPRTCFPVWNRGKLGIMGADSVTTDIRRVKDDCYIFSGKMRPETWPPGVLSQCGRVNLFVSRQLKANADEWEQLFATFGYRGKVGMRKYFVWYGDRPAHCVKAVL